jgi:hypothetical protein
LIFWNFPSKKKIILSYVKRAKFPSRPRKFKNYKISFYQTWWNQNFQWSWQLFDQQNYGNFLGHRFLQFVDILTALRIRNFTIKLWHLQQHKNIRSSINYIPLKLITIKNGITWNFIIKLIARHLIKSSSWFK